MESSQGPSCEHSAFKVDGTVVGIREGKSGVQQWVLQLRVNCSQCGGKFGFTNMPIGFPGVSVDGLEARLSIVPEDRLEEVEPRPKIILPPH